MLFRDFEDLRLIPQIGFLIITTVVYFCPMIKVSEMHSSAPGKHNQSDYFIFELNTLSLLVFGNNPWR